MNQTNTLEVLPKEPTAAVATDADIKHHFRAAEQAMEAVRTAARAIAISGALLLEKKASLEHGEWMPWLEANDIGKDSAARHMNVARAVMATLEISHRAKFANLTFAETLLLPEPELPPLALKARQKFEEITSDKSAKQLVFEWRAKERPQPKYHPPVRTEAQILKDANDALQSLIEQAMGSLASLRHEFTQGNGRDADWQRLLGACVETSNTLRKR